MLSTSCTFTSAEMREKRMRMLLVNYLRIIDCKQEATKIKEDYRKVTEVARESVWRLTYTQLKYL